MTPDSSKSTQEKFKEGVTDMGDKAARYDLLYHLRIDLSNY